MPKSKREINPPRGISRFLFRMPIILYRIGLGGLMGRRFLLLNHTGRESGLPRQNVLEVIRRDEERKEFVVVSAYGKKADWYQNILKHPQVNVQAGRYKIMAKAIPLTQEETLDEFTDYNLRNPGLIFSFATMVGHRVAQSEKGLKELSRLMHAVRLQADGT